MISVGRTQGVANVPFNNKIVARNVKAPAMFTNMMWPNMGGVKGYKLSAAAKGASPLVSAVTATTN